MIPIGDDDSTIRTVPLVTYALVAINVAVFVMELGGGNRFVVEWSFIPRRFVTHPLGDFRTVFTAMFMHAGFLHLGGNMLYLWIFGNNVEDRFGHFRFLVFYILCGVAATFAQFVFNFGSPIPNLGASGAIAGVLAAYLVMSPGRWIQVLVGFFVIPLPAIFVIGIWFGLQLMNGAGALAHTTSGGGVAYLAHIGGFVAGLVYTFRYSGSQKHRGVR